MIDNFAIAMWLVGAMGLAARHVVLVWSDPERTEKRRIDAMARASRDREALR